MKRLSTVICTLNRVEYLKKSLESLIAQSFPQEHFQIIVIDNGSTDGSQEWVRTLQVHHPELQLWVENQKGLSKARNLALRKCTTDYIAYLDDDAIADPDWVKSILATVDRVRPAPKCLGGKVLPIWESPRPKWLSDSLLAVLSILDWGDHEKTLKEEEYLVGAGICFHRNSLLEMGGFPENLGRVGNQLLSGEEIWVEQKLRDSGHPSFYDPKIVVQHHIQKTRLNQDWFLKRAYWQGVTSAVIYLSLTKCHFFKRIAIFANFLVHALFSRQLILAFLSKQNEDSEIFALKYKAYARVGFLRVMLLGIGQKTKKSD